MIGELVLDLAELGFEVRDLVVDGEIGREIYEERN